MKDNLPGVHLRVTTSSLRKVGTSIGASISFVGEVNDEAVWKEVLARLQKEGLKIYSVDDFKTELLNTLREEVRVLESKLLSTTQELMELRHQNSVFMAWGNIGKEGSK